MPTVLIRLHAPLSERLGLATGGRRALLEETFEPGACVRDVLTRLAERYPAFRAIALDPQTDRLVRPILLTVNGRLLTASDEYGLPLQERDEIVFLPAAFGG